MKLKPKKKAVLNKTLCDHSPACPAKRACKVGAITQKTKWLIMAEFPKIEPEICIGCGECVKLCPHHAIKMK